MIIMREATVSKQASSSSVADVSLMFEGPAVTVWVRQVEGVELLQMIGFDKTYLPTEWPSHKLGTFMAGNAFSGFCIMPCLIALAAVVVPDSILAPSPPPAHPADAMMIDSDADISDVEVL
jgi:hypothetical protein